MCQAGAAVVLTGGVWLACAVDSQEFASVDGQQEQRDNGDAVGDGDKGEVQPVGHK